MAWAPGKGVKKTYNDEWDVDSGVTYIPYDKLPDDLTQFVDGGMLDVESLPEGLRSVYNEWGKIATQHIPIPAAPPTAAVAATPYPPYAGIPGKCIRYALRGKEILHWCFCSWLSTLRSH